MNSVHHSGARALASEPGIHNHDGEYGFPDAQLRICGLRQAAHPGMTAGVERALTPTLSPRAGRGEIALHNPSTALVMMLRWISLEPP
jgi:hypothetical protein